MTLISWPTVRPAMTVPSGGLLGWSRTLVDALVARWLRRAAIKALRELDDRQLRDIGLLRCQIKAAVRGMTNPELARLR